MKDIRNEKDVLEFLKDWKGRDALESWLNEAATFVDCQKFIELIQKAADYQEFKDDQADEI